MTSSLQGVGHYNGTIGGVVSNGNSYEGIGGSSGGGANGLLSGLNSQFEDAGYIIRVLSKVLTQLIDVNQKSNTRQHFVTKFQSSYAPAISIQGYLERINKYAKCSPNCFIVALIYIDRLIEIRNIVLTSLNVHRILITSVLLATKVFDDEFYKNAYYAKLGGVSTAEMNTLEIEFLSLVNFKLSVSLETFEKYQQELQSFMAVSTSPVAISSNLIDGNLEKSLGGLCESGLRIAIPESDDRAATTDPSTISPLRPIDVNFTVPRSLLFNPIVQLSSVTPQVSDNTTSSTSSSVLFNPEDCVYNPPTHSIPWVSSNSSLSSTTLPSISSSALSHDSPRSLVSYPSSDPSPTLPSASSQYPHIYSQQSIFSQTCQKQDSGLHQEMLPSESHLLLHPNGGVGSATSDMDGIYEYPHPRTMMDGYNYPDNTYPLSHPTIQPFPVRTNPYGAISSHPPMESSHQQPYPFKHSNISVSSTLAVPQQKSSSRQRVSTYSQSTSAVVHSQLPQYNTRMYPSYQSRHPQNPSETNGPIHSQHYDVSGNGYNNLPSQQPSFSHAPNYHPNGYGYSSQNSFCLHVNHIHGGNHMQFPGSYPHQQNHFAGGYYYQPAPSPLISGPRFLAPSSTPNSVGDIFGPNGENAPSRQNLAYHTEMGGRHHIPIGHPTYGGSHLYPVGFGAQQYYPDLIASTGPIPPHPFPDMQSLPNNQHLNAYPSATLFYPMALRT